MNKTPSGSAATKYKKYIYYDELSFLAPTVENEVDESLNESLPSPSLPPPSVNTDNTLDSMVSSENTQDFDILTQKDFSNTQQGEQNDRGVDSATSQKPWLQKRKRNPPGKNPESSLFEKELLTLLSNQTPDLAADDLAFFASLGPILKFFDVGQKLEFRSRVLREATDIHSNRSNSSNSSYSNDARPTLDTYASYNYRTPGYQGYETNDANLGYSGYQTARRTDE